MQIRILQFAPDVKLPERQHYNDAGADVYCPQDVYIANGETTAIPLGFGLELPDGLMGLIYTRSSMARDGISLDLPPIDSGYRGEVHAVVHNHSGRAVKLDKDQRIGQLVIQPIIMADFTTKLGESRGTGAFGSTGK